MGWDGCSLIAQLFKQVPASGVWRRPAEAACVGKYPVTVVGMVRACRQRPLVLVVCAADADQLQAGRLPYTMHNTACCLVQYFLTYVCDRVK
jgi:hypothetical protein